MKLTSKMRGMTNSPVVGFLHDLNTQIRRERINVPISGTMKAKKIAHVQDILSTSEIEASNFLSLPYFLLQKGIVLSGSNCEVISKRLPLARTDPPSTAANVTRYAKI
jgi:hypothetical protein